MSVEFGSVDVAQAACSRLHITLHDIAAILIATWHGSLFNLKKLEAKPDRIGHGTK
jgi:hypothetical protein